MIQRSIIKRIAFYAGIVVIWQSLYSTHLIPELILPSPLQVIESLASSTAKGTLPFAVGTSLWRLFAGLLIAIPVGFATGFYMARYKTVYETLGSLILGLQSIPSIAWIPVGVIWFGINDAGIIFIIFISTVFSISMSTYAGIRSVSPIYVKAARNMGAKSFTLLAQVVFPAALPHLVSGLRQAWSFAWRGLINAEMLFAFLGLGFMLYVARFTYDMAQVISVMLVIMVIGLVMDALIFSRIEKFVESRWGLR